MKYEDYLLRALTIIKNQIDDNKMNKTLTDDAIVRRRLSDNVRALTMASELIRTEIHEVTGE